MLGTLNKILNSFYIVRFILFSDFRIYDIRNGICFIEISSSNSFEKPAKLLIFPTLFPYFNAV